MLRWPRPTGVWVSSRPGHIQSVFVCGDQKDVWIDSGKQTWQRLGDYSTLTGYRLLTAWLFLNSRPRGPQLYELNKVLYGNRRRNLTWNVLLNLKFDLDSMATVWRKKAGSAKYVSDENVKTATVIVRVGCCGFYYRRAHAAGIQQQLFYLRIYTAVILLNIYSTNSLHAGIP